MKIELTQRACASCSFFRHGMTEDPKSTSQVCFLLLEEISVCVAIISFKLSAFCMALLPSSSTSKSRGPLYTASHRNRLSVSRSAPIATMTNSLRHSQRHSFKHSRILDRDINVHINVNVNVNVNSSSRPKRESKQQQSIRCRPPPTSLRSMPMPTSRTSRVRTTRRHFATIAPKMAFLVFLLACSILPFPQLLLFVAAVDDRGALEALYDGTGGDNWINNTDWKSSKPYCSWHGIVCGDNSGVTSITLNQNNLNGEIPPSFWTLPQLTHAQFRGNSITNAGFTGITSNCPVEVIVFSENDLTDLTGIGNAKATLKNLNLNKNQLDKALPDEFFDLTNLETVFLAFNQIQGSLPTLIGKLSKLTELYAFSNQFTGSIPSEIGLLDVCQILGLGNNDFTGHLPAEINRMANMRDLSVHHMREVGDSSPNDHPGLSGPLPTFGDMPYLTLLFLDGNSLTGTIPSDFLRHNENINVPLSIGLANNMFTGALPKSLERFQSLSIDLAGNSISEIPTELCDLGGWMGGLVQKYKCDAILCPRQTYNKEGRASSDGNLCQPCTDGYEFLGAQTCSSDPSEQEPWQILAGFYLAMGGDQWTLATGWSTLNAVLATTTEEELPTLTVDICTGWYGVVCENGQVTQISLPRNDLFGTVPDSIFQLKALRMLDVSGNNVQMTDFHAAAKAQALTTLVLSDIKLKALDGIGDIPNLHLLYLDGIDNAEPMPSELFQLTGLKILHLQHGSFTGTLPTLVGQLSSLEVLNLYGNQLSGFLPTELGQLTLLHALDLSENKFGGTLPTELNALSSLTTFAIHQTKGRMTGNLPPFDVFPNLKQLNLASNGFKGSIPDTFLAGIADKGSDIVVELGTNQLTGTIPTSLNDFDRLYISLEGNLIEGLPTVLCSNVNWMLGEVEKSSCDAILCPPMTWNEFGKAASQANLTCLPCPGNPAYYGQTLCGTVGVNREKEILDLLFASTGGPYWNHTHDNWMKPGIPICQREGVLCGGGATTANEGVTELRLQNFGLRGHIPSEIWQLPKIRSLGFSFNAVDMSFSGIEAATNLVVLKVSNCNLRSLKDLRNAPARLGELHLASNQLEGSIPEDLYKLGQVRKMFLNNNHFTGKISTEIGTMTNLLELWVWDNSLTGVLPSELGLLTNLQAFSVSDNELSGAIPSELEALSHLSKILLARQRSKGKFAGPLPTFPNSEFVVEVDVSENSFSGWLPPGFLAKTDPVETITVNLAGNRFTGPIPKDWDRFESLNLDLSSNMISEIPDTLCASNGWNNGLVGLLGTCDAILCKPGTYHISGRQTDPNQGCQSCSSGVASAPYYGSTVCLEPALRAEREVLVDFYNGANGTSWLIQTNWLEADTTCTWYGVACDENGFIIGLELQNNWLKSTGAALQAASLVFSLSNLKTLDLKGNEMDLDLQQIPGTSQLEFLRLSGSGLRSLTGISRASKLKALHVTNNHITTIPTELYRLASLESLFLSFNAISGTISRMIGDMSNLKEFYVFGNRLTGTIPTEVATLEHLTDFVVANNYLSGTLPTELNSMLKLEQVSLYDQKGLELITGPVPSFSQAPNLWYFDASNNDLTGPIPDNFMLNSLHLNDTVTIYLQNNEITGTIPAALQKFDLLDINLAGNLLVDIPTQLCTIDGWMGGNVGTVGNCNAILCPKGTFNQFGKESMSNLCLPCSQLAGIDYIGQTRCEDFTSERETLNVLFSNTGGEFWNISTNWQSEAPICSWEGILCEDGDLQDTEGITSIQLDANGLDGTLPSVIWTLPSLRFFSVRENPNLHVDFDGLANAAETLEVLYLSKVKIKSVKGISQATGLKEIHLTGNELTGVFPQEFFALSNTLEQLYISYNLFYGQLPSRLGELNKLSVFFAFGNDFLSTIPTELARMTNLQTLVLSENLLYGPIPTELSSMASLQVFSVFREDKSGPRLSGSLPAFHRVPQLTDLYLQGNELQGTIPKDFLSASLNAALIKLGSNLLTGDVPSELAALTALALQLEDNKISAFPKAFCDKRDWMDGAIATYGCDAFLCPPGSSSPEGRTLGEATKCATCSQADAAPYYGTTSCEGPPADRDILINLYYATDGDNWTRKDFWGSTADVCDWYGIACVSGQVVEINLRANNLVGLPPPDLFYLRGLQILWLYSNPIKFSFENVGSAVTLQDLRLDGTHLHSLHGVGAARSLIALDVRFTDIKGTFPQEILQLTNLRSLSLSGNRLSGNLPSSFAALKFLGSLRLDSNRFSGRLPAFDDMHFTRYLDLSQNALTGALSKNVFGKLAETEQVTLNLAGNQITGVVPEELDRFAEVTIYLRDNRILGLPLLLCDNGDWNGGDVGNYGCDAILCKPGTFNKYGRYRPGSRCSPCPTARYYGLSSCPPSAGSHLHGSRGLGVALAGGMLLLQLVL